MLSQSQLFARLAEGHAARITVVTPNRRLAHSLTLEFDDYQIARGLTSWEAADILPFGAWVERLWDLMAGHLAQLKLPSLVVAYAFDAMPPQTREFLSRFPTEECAPDPVTSSLARVAYPSAKHELESAAKWARARLEEGKKRIGVVVPDLGKRRQEVARVFARVMDPGYNLPGRAKAPMPFNISLGRPLGAYPLVDAALGLLELSHQPVEFVLASHLIRSPFIGGADSEMAKRATLDVRLRRDADATIPLAKIIAAAAEPTPVLRQRLEAMFAVEKKADSPSEWARHFSAVLEAAGFPGERALDSDEFQTRAKWHEMLGELSKLERVAERMPFDSALGTLRRLCADTLFQPESPDAPIQILGVLEAQGQRFDCLWVSGLTDVTWPRDAHPNPFIPLALQKKAGIPQASAETSLAYDRRITEEWKAAAAEVVFSHPTKEEDRDLAPSPLINQIPEGAIALPDYPRYRDLVFSSKKLESFEDWRAPKLKLTPGKTLRGGTRVLADQAMCPFRAFARWRLGAEEMEEPSSGLDA